MIKKRIGTDLFIKMTILEDGNPADLSNVYDLKAYVTKLDTQENTIKTPKISGNIATIQWNSSNNKELGMYSATIEYSRTSSDSETGYIHYITDIPCAFCIVRYSTQEENTDTCVLLNMKKS